MAKRRDMLEALAGAKALGAKDLTLKRIRNLHMDLRGQKLIEDAEGLPLKMVSILEGACRLNGEAEVIFAMTEVESAEPLTASAELVDTLKPALARIVDGIVDELATRQADREATERRKEQALKVREDAKLAAKKVGTSARKAGAK